MRTAMIICTRTLLKLKAIEAERVVDTQMDMVLTRDVPSLSLRSRASC